MLNRSLALLAVAVFCVVAVHVRAADQPTPQSLDQFLAGIAAGPDDGSVAFTPEAFAQAQAAGAVIVIHVNAFWCSTCGVQRNALADSLADLKKKSAFVGLTVFRVDFDSQKDVVKRFGVRSQGTLIVFRGNKEIGRSIGTTSEADIEALLTRAQSENAGAVSGAAALLSGGSYVLALLAGILSSLSPCVLPLLPIVIGGAATTHRFGAVALAGGFALSFFAVGMLVEAIGLGAGLDRETVRIVAASFMIVFGIVMLSAFLQQRLALAGGGLERAADSLMRWTTPLGLRGQFLVGLLLGGIWSPCIGPTLGAAISLAGERDTFAQVALVMLLFGLGVALPLLAIGLLSHQALLRWRQQIEIADHAAKSLFGGLMVAVGVAILVGADRSVETLLLRISPDWLTRLPTIF